MDQRGWTLEKFGQRAGISTSLAHQIANEGKDNVRAKTFEGIARAFGMTPAQLRQRIDGDLSAEPLTEQRARIARLLPDVPDELLDGLEQHVTLAVQPTLRPTNGRRDGASTRRSKAEAQKAASRGTTGEADAQGGVSTVYGRPHSRFASTIAFFERLVNPRSGLSLAEAV